MRSDGQGRTCSSATILLRAACALAGASALKIDHSSEWQTGSVDSFSPAMPSSINQRQHQSDAAMDGIGRGQYGWKSVGRREHTAIYTDGQGYRQTMRNYGETQYLSFFSLGGQTMAGILDTGSFELVVFSKNCTTCGKTAKYNPDLSASHRSGKMYSGQYYGSGETWSQEASDRLGIGPYKVNQTFWEVSKAKMPVLYQSEFNAIIGIGPPETPAVDAWEFARKAAHNVSDTLSTLGDIDESTLQKARDKAKIAVAMHNRSPVLKSIQENMFSVCIGKELGGDGVFIWNDTSVARHPELFHKVPVIGRRSWSVEAHNARLSYVMNATQERLANEVEVGAEEHHAFNNSSSISLGCEDGCGILLDSGTSLLALPHAVINRLVQVISEPTLNCSNMLELPHLVFDMNGQTFSLPPDVYVTEVTYEVPSYLQGVVRIRNLGKEIGRRCDLLAMESYAKTSSGPLWIFGMPFFRKYYTSFQVGLNNKERALYFAGASSFCTPVKRRVEVHDGPDDMWKRIINPAQLWMPLSVQLASAAEYVRL